MSNKISNPKKLIKLFLGFEIWDFVGYWDLEI
jgi:hypothetical protein